MTPRIVRSPLRHVAAVPAWICVLAALALLFSPQPAGAVADAPAPASAAVEKVETTFESVDATVSAQWEFPAHTPAPLVVLMPASEAVDRDGLPPGYGEDPATGIYAQFARKLLDAGFAVFRYDSPGTGRSSAGQFSTVRSTALEAYTRAVDHPKVDREHVFLIGHSASTDSVVGIYPRYAAVRPPAGVVLLANIVGETEIVNVDAPTLIIVSDKTPDEIYQHGQFPKDARSRSTTKKLETSLVVLSGAEETLLSPVDKNGGGKALLDRTARGRRHARMAARKSRPSDQELTAGDPGPSQLVARTPPVLRIRKARRRLRRHQAVEFAHVEPEAAVLLFGEHVGVARPPDNIVGLVRVARVQVLQRRLVDADDRQHELHFVAHELRRSHAEQRTDSSIGA